MLMDNGTMEFYTFRLEEKHMESVLLARPATLNLLRNYSRARELLSMWSEIMK